MVGYYINPNGTLPLNPGGTNAPVLINQGQWRSRCDCCYCPCYDFFTGEDTEFRKNKTGFPCCGIVEEYLLTQTQPYKAYDDRFMTRIVAPVVLSKLNSVNIGDGRNNFACNWGASSPAEFSKDGGTTWQQYSYNFEIVLSGPTTNPIGRFQWAGIEGRCIWELQYGFQIRFTSDAGPFYKFYFQNDTPVGTYDVAPYFAGGQFLIS
jgi:hypothetical protein